MASGAATSRSMPDFPGSTPFRLSTVSMHCHGVGASAKETTVFPTRSGHRKLGSRLTAHQEEAVPAAHLGEVDDHPSGTLGEIEAPHEPAEADLDVAIEQSLDRALAKRRGRHGLDVEPLVCEMAERYTGRQRSVERRIEGQEHGHRRRAMGVSS